MRNHIVSCPLLLVHCSLQSRDQRPVHELTKKETHGRVCQPGIEPAAARVTWKRRRLKTMSPHKDGYLEIQPANEIRFDCECPPAASLLKAMLCCFLLVSHGCRPRWRWSAPSKTGCSLPGDLLRDYLLQMLWHADNAFFLGCMTVH